MQTRNFINKCFLDNYIKNEQIEIEKFMNKLIEENKDILEDYQLKDNLSFSTYLKNYLINKISLHSS